MIKPGFHGTKVSLPFNFLLFKVSQKEMGDKRDQGRLHVGENSVDVGKSVVFCPPLWPPRLLLQVLALYSMSV